MARMQTATNASVRAIVTRSSTAMVHQNPIQCSCKRLIPSRNRKDVVLRGYGACSDLRFVSALRTAATRNYDDIIRRSCPEIGAAEFAWEVGWLGLPGAVGAHLYVHDDRTAFYRLIYQ